MPRWSQRSRRGTSKGTGAGVPFPGVADAPTFENVVEDPGNGFTYNIRSPAAYPSDTVRWDLLEGFVDPFVVKVADYGLNSDAWADGPNEPDTSRWFLRSYNTQGNFTDGLPVVGPPAV
jgi:hypothetical protein